MISFLFFMTFQVFAGFFRYFCSFSWLFMTFHDQDGFSGFFRFFQVRGHPDTRKIRVLFCVLYKFGEGELSLVKVNQKSFAKLAKVKRSLCATLVCCLLCKQLFLWRSLCFFSSISVCKWVCLIVSVFFYFSTHLTI